MDDILKAKFKKHLDSGETLVVMGNLTIDDEDLFEIPYLRVRGDLTLRNMFSLRRIWGLEVAGDLTIDSCDLLESLPRLCNVGKTLKLKFNTLLADVGIKLSCRALEIESCTSMTIVELGIEECRTISLKDCGNLEIVTQKKITWVPSEVTIEDCGLVMVPSGLKVGTTLRVLNCKNLESVGSDVFSGGDMDFSGCSQLRTIGKKLFVGNNLTLKNTGLEKLPEDLSVEGILEVAGSPIKNLKAIAETTRVQWRGKNAESLNTYPIERKVAEDILKLESKSERERAIRQLTTISFLKAAGERFNRHKLDPDGSLRAVQDGRGAGDLYWVTKGKTEPTQRQRPGLPGYSEAAIMHVIGWWEIRNTFQQDWHRN